MLLRIAGLSRLIAATVPVALTCMPSCDSIELPRDSIELPRATVLRLTIDMQANTLMERQDAPLLWKVEVDGSPITTGTALAAEVIDIPITVDLTENGRRPLIVATAWMDIDRDMVRHALEPVSTTTVDVSRPGGSVAAADRSGRTLNVFNLRLVVDGEGGTGTLEKPFPLDAHTWTEISSYNHGTSYLKFRAAEAGAYVLISKSNGDYVDVGFPASDNEISSAVGNNSGTMGADRFARPLAAGEEVLLSVFYRPGTALMGWEDRVEVFTILAMRLPEPGDNAAHVLVDGLGDEQGPAIFDFAEITTASALIGYSTRYYDGMGGLTLRSNGKP